MCYDLTIINGSRKRVPSVIHTTTCSIVTSDAEMRPNYSNVSLYVFVWQLTPWCANLWMLLWTRISRIHTHWTERRSWLAIVMSLASATEDVNTLRTEVLALFERLRTSESREDVASTTATDTVDTPVAEIYESVAKDTVESQSQGHQCFEEKNLCRLCQATRKVVLSKTNSSSLLRPTCRAFPPLARGSAFGVWLNTESFVAFVQVAQVMGRHSAVLILPVNQVESCRETWR